MSDLCPIAVSPQYSDQDEYQPVTVGESHLLLLRQKKYCDVTFTFPNLPDRIEAHEFCLKARSPLFEQIFRMRKSGNVQGREIEISESTPKIFQQFLEFIYADIFNVNMSEALDLLCLSEKYEVRPLTTKCEEILQTEMPPEASVKVFESARRHGRRELMDRAGQIMAKSFLKLVRIGELTNAEEETLVHLLESDDLNVKEVGLFKCILDWGRNRFGLIAQKLMRNKLDQLISKIRYTNMATDEFQKVVVPTGLLTAEETVSVYSYFCGDESSRKDLQIKFNTTRRRAESIETASKLLGFYSGQQPISQEFPAFAQQYVSFKVDRTQVGWKLMSGYLLEKAVITKIRLKWPKVNSQYRQHSVLNFNVSLREYFGPVKDGNFTIRFQKKLLNCIQGHLDLVSVQPPVELICGRRYSILVEDLSTSDLIGRFRDDPIAYSVDSFQDIKRKATVKFEDMCMNFNEIRRNTDYYAQKSPDRCEEAAVITGFRIILV